MRGSESIADGTATTIFLVRHAAHALIDRVLLGRKGTIGLSAAGCVQANGLGRHFARAKLAALQTSPQPRAFETARAIAESAAIRVETTSALDELDMGEWTGRSFDELARDPRWRLWNERRASTCPPAGESIAMMQDRMLAHIARMHTLHPNGSIVMVSHAEPIRSVVLHYLDLSVDDFMSVQIDSASVTTVLAWPGGGRIVHTNQSIEDSLAA
jgi:probable phosphoglycerate mutase